MDDNIFQTSIEKALNILPINEVVPKANYVEQMKENSLDDGALKDFEKARSNIVNIIDVGTQAVSSLGQLASASQSSEHYEVLSKLIKDLSDTSEKLLKTHEQIEKIYDKRGSKKNDGPILTSTMDISLLVKKAEEETKKPSE
jgi:hypothetical protein